MKQGLIDKRQEEKDEYEPRCFGLYRVRKRRFILEEQPADDIVTRLHALMRAQKARVANFASEENEERLAAAYQMNKTPPNRDLARTHLRISIAARKTQNDEMLKYEQLRSVANKLDQARRTASETTSMFTTAKTLQEIVQGMPDAANVMDMLREQLHLVDEHAQELAAPLRPVDAVVGPGPRDVEEELDALFNVAKAPVASVASVAPVRTEKKASLLPQVV